MLVFFLRIPFERLSSRAPFRGYPSSVSALVLISEDFLGMSQLARSFLRISCERLGSRVHFLGFPVDVSARVLVL